VLEYPTEDRSGIVAEAGGERTSAISGGYRGPLTLTQRRFLTAMAVTLAVACAGPQSKFTLPPLPMGPPAIAPGATLLGEFVFTGTVVKVGEHPGTALPAGWGSFVVRVDQVSRTPEGLGEWTGREIDVLTEPSSGAAFQEGAQSEFVTYAWRDGDSVVFQYAGTESRSP